MLNFFIVIIILLVHMIMLIMTVIVIVIVSLGMPIVAQALDGFNGTIFAYGQTGSGKSWSMIGKEGNKGSAFLEDIMIVTIMI